MKLSSDLITGNIWLYMLTYDPKKVSFHQSEFMAYCNILKQIVAEMPEVINSGYYIDVHLGDILDMAYSFNKYVKFISHVGDECPSELRLRGIENAREILIRKLKIYIRGITPKWLLDAIERACIERATCEAVLPKFI